MARRRNPHASSDVAAGDDLRPHGPVRTCIGCRKRVTASELLRVTAGSGGDGRPAVVPDPTATSPGRGAHLHPTSECYDLAERRKAFSRALRLEGGCSSAPVGEYVATLADRDQPDRKRSNSS